MYDHTETQKNLPWATTNKIAQFWLFSELQHYVGYFDDDEDDDDDDDDKFI